MNKPGYIQRLFFRKWLPDRYKKKTGMLLLLAALGWAISFALNVPQKIKDRPGGEHIWAQIDRGSQAMCFYQEGMHLFKPTTHNDRYANGGYAVSEFPWISYLAAALYHLFGPHEAIFRILVLVLTGLFFSSYVFFSSPFSGGISLSFLSFAIAVTSPNILYYSLTFLPDTVALGLVLFAVVMLYRFLLQKRLAFLYVFLGTALLACLTKQSCLLLIGAAILAAFFHIWIRDKTAFPVFSRKLLPFSLVLLGITLSWNYYAHALNTKYGSIVFIMWMVPPANISEFRELAEIWIGRMPHFYAPLTWWIIGISTMVNLWFYKKTGPFWLVFILAGTLSWLVFFTLMIQNAHHHEYYFIPFQAIVFIIVARAFYTLYTFLPKPIYTWILYVLMTGIVWLNIRYAQQEISPRWAKNREGLSRFYTMEPCLRNLGIHYEELIISYPDISSNITLYLMNQKGISMHDLNNLPNIIGQLHFCRYAVIDDTTSFFKEPEIRKRIGEKIDDCNGVGIYQVKKEL